jgi:hypothetical protein
VAQQVRELVPVQDVDSGGLRAKWRAHDRMKNLELARFLGTTFRLRYQWASDSMKDANNGKISRNFSYSWLDLRSKCAAKADGDRRGQSVSQFGT